MTVIVDNTGFSVTHWSRFNEADFIEQNLKAGAFKQYSNGSRRKLLSETYKLIQLDIARITKEAERV